MVCLGAWWAPLGLLALSLAAGRPAGFEHLAGSTRVYETLKVGGLCGLLKHAQWMQWPENCQMDMANLDSVSVCHETGVAHDTNFGEVPAVSMFVQDSVNPDRAVTIPDRRP